MTLKEYIETIEGPELEEVSRYIFTRNVQRLVEYLPTERISDLEAVLFKEFEGLPFALINKVLKYRDVALAREIDHPSADAVGVIGTILRLSGDHRTPIQSIVVLKGVDKQELPEDARLILAIYLAGLPDIPEKEFVTRVKKDVFLLPALLSRLRNVGHAMEALRWLDEYIENADIQYVRPRIAEIVYKYLTTDKQDEQPFRNIKTFLNASKPRTVAVIEGILAAKAFGALRDRLKEQPPEMEIFHPNSLREARSLLDLQAAGKRTGRYPDLNMNALAFALAEKMDEGPHEPIEKLTDVFIHYDKLHTQKLHYILHKYEISYDPDKLVVEYKDKKYRLKYTLDKFRKEATSGPVNNLAGSRASRIMEMLRTARSVLPV